MRKQLSLNLKILLLLLNLTLLKVYSQTGYSFSDNRDNSVYKIISIGDQVWMAENLVFQSNYSEYLETVHKAKNDSKKTNFGYAMGVGLGYRVRDFKGVGIEYECCFDNPTWNIDENISSGKYRFNYFNGELGVMLNDFQFLYTASASWSSKNPKIRSDAFSLLYDFKLEDKQFSVSLGPFFESERITMPLGQHGSNNYHVSYYSKMNFIGPEVIFSYHKKMNDKIVLNFNLGYQYGEGLRNIQKPSLRYSDGEFYQFINLENSNSLFFSDEGYLFDKQFHAVVFRVRILLLN